MHFFESLASLSFFDFSYWSYVLIFVTASLEAVPLLGFFSPGMVIVIIGGLLAKLGVLGLGEVVLFASLGATIGDLIGYYIGSRYGYSFLDKYGKYFLFRKRQYEITKHVMNNHTGKSLIIGRFNSFTRSFAPFIAGSTDTPFGRFLKFNRHCGKPGLCGWVNSKI